MGVPVISLAGHSHRSRVGATILGAVGLSDLVATSADQYVELAAGLSEKPALLRELRAGLRTRMRESPLTDAAGFVSDLEGAYRRMWKEAFRKGVLS
jgi:predicted O-linked N-acetylglucosamine transferase (SPINDLY family)